MKNNLLSVVLTIDRKLGKPNPECSEEITWTHGACFFLCENFTNNLLIFASDITRSFIWWKREKMFCKRWYVSETLNCSIEITGIAEVP